MEAMQEFRDSLPSILSISDIFDTFLQLFCIFSTLGKPGQIHRIQEQHTESFRFRRQFHGNIEKITEAHHFSLNALKYYLNIATNTPYVLDKKAPNFAQGLDFLRFQMAVYTVFHQESESGIKKCNILEPGGKT